MILTPKIKKLIRIYLNIISADHHKSKDGYFSTSYVYNGFTEKYSFYVTHNGYVNNFETECSNLEECYKEWETRLIEILEGQFQDWRKVSEIPHDPSGWFTPIEYPSNMEELEKEFKYVIT